MPAEDLRVFEEFSTRDHRLELIRGDEIITLPAGLSRPAHPSSTRSGSHGSRHLQQTLHQRGFSRARRTRNNQNQRRENLGITHSMFCTCSRNFSISAFTSRPMPVICRASLSTPGVLESMVLASRCISCRRKSSFLRGSPALSNSFANCCR